MFSSRVIQRTFWTVARLSFKTATGLSVISYQLSVISYQWVSYQLSGKFQLKPQNPKNPTT
ncbi:unknown protein [Microcystis aeruginosa NIES-843]|uniref:Uncharacterized protein n=1 Tax=Microcystis aeruginosa (strain NIES-843 / IAM M-2473) TaxID=449447 RepID=B0JI17_MICAN|nr:unknown protein [Microcystis aeruginosa NIES-843]